MERRGILPEALHHPRTRLRVECIDGLLVTERTGAFVPAVRHTRDDAGVDVFVEFLETLAEETALVEEHVVFAEKHLDVVWDAVCQHVILGEAG